MLNLFIRLTLCALLTLGGIAMAIYLLACGEPVKALAAFVGMVYAGAMMRPDDELARLRESIGE